MKLFIAALPLELAFLRKKLQYPRVSFQQGLVFYQGNLANTPVGLVCTGVGKEKVLETLPRLTRYPIDSVLCLGFSGALDPQLKTGEAFWIHRIQSPESQLNLTIPQRLHLPPATLYTANQVLYSSEEKLLLSQNSCLVDMESYYIAEFFQHRHIPFSCIRIVLDTLQDPLYPMNFVSAEGKIHLLRFFSFVCKHPPKNISYLNRLRKKSNWSAQRLGEIGLSWLEGEKKDTMRAEN
jgi:nucleoside phosphorylase